MIDILNQMRALLEDIQYTISRRWAVIYPIHDSLMSSKTLLK